MVAAEFEQLVERLRREKPKWFGLEPDPPATPLKIQKAERALDATFPAEYTFFLLRYGGGYFAFGNVFSVEDESEWGVVARNQAAGLLSQGFLAVSENGTGDYYGFSVENGQCRSAVRFWDHETQETSVLYADLFAFLLAVALKP